MGACQDRVKYRYKVMKGFYRPEHGAGRPLAGDLAQLQLGLILRRARYTGWTLCVGNLGETFWVEAYRSDPAEPTRLQRLGPWPIPSDADEDQVFALVLDAVAETDGEAARSLVRFVTPKGEK